MTRPDASPARTAAARPPRSSSRRPARAILPAALRATVVVLVFSLVMGGLTSPAQGFLPSWMSSLANSAGGWSMLAFLGVWLSRARPLLGAVLGAASFVAMVEAYGVVSLWRGYFLADPFSSMWIPIGLVAGPFIGLAAALVRHASRRWPIAGVAVLSAALVAEGVYGLTVVAETTSPVYWTLEIVLAVGFLAAAALRGRRPTDAVRGGVARP
ncbi:hypothetical protein DZF92_08975 [Clavibacter michiganensis subsp. insidiosus]|nr:DUF6518 family protein [Clavibacter michiganensis]OQJ61369.1 hypothetical protein B5P21_14220 [Clavibacter michiganensis subsp. insidiosus]RII86880.1 hypothetical protein DZF92_08975 [Clavibacter michiganensis subsp. insidiosus]RMC83845.1 hypothetical protein CmiCFBP2404_13920 [Clavibacter michiganensis subsp. insidiosus]